MSEGFDMDSASNLSREKIGATKTLQYLGHQAKNDFGHFCAHNLTLVKTGYSNAEDPNNYLNMDYGMHLGTKNDYLFFQSSPLLEVTEIQLIQNQYKQERTDLHELKAGSGKSLLSRLCNHKESINILGNRPQFSLVASLPKGRLNSHRMNQCYDRIPVLYQSVDTFTRQTYSDANARN